MVQLRSAIKDVLVRAAMMTDFHTLSEYDTLGDVVDVLLAGSQQDFPVIDNSHIVGVLSRNDLLKGLAETGHETPVVDVMQREYRTVEDAELLEHAFEKMKAGGCSMLPVLRRGELVGVITLENFGEWVMVQSALDRGQAAQNVRGQCE